MRILLTRHRRNALLLLGRQLFLAEAADVQALHLRWELLPKGFAPIIKLKKERALSLDSALDKQGQPEAVEHSALVNTSNVQGLCCKT